MTMATRKKKGATVEIKQLHNKSRQGTYVYVKTQGKRGSYYKMKSGLPLATYILRYTQRTGPIANIITKEERREQEARKRIEKLRQQPIVQQTIASGISTSKSLSVWSRQGTINKYVNDLLRPHVLDKRLLRLISMEENQRKIMTGYEYRIEFISTDGTLGATGKIIGHYTPRELMNKLREHFRNGESIYEQSQYDHDTEMEGDKYWAFKNMHMTTSFKKTYFKLKDIRITTIYRHANH